jgi:hypothetical protein
MVIKRTEIKTKDKSSKMAKRRVKTKGAKAGGEANQPTGGGADS